MKLKFHNVARKTHASTEHIWQHITTQIIEDPPPLKKWQKPDYKHISMKKTCSEIVFNIWNE